MKLPVVLLVSCLISTNYISTMNYKGPVDLQTQSALSAIPFDVVPKFLWMNTTWATVRSVLALQATCRLWHKSLDVEYRKKMVGLWLNDGKEFDPQSCLHRALKEVSFSHINNPHFTPEMFLFAGGQVDHTTERGDSPLMSAVNTDCPSIDHIQMLIRMGAAINHQNDDGDTALHFAARKGLERCVEVLLQNDADKTLKNCKGKTPIQCIEKMPNSYGGFSRFSLTGIREQRNERIEALLDDDMTPEESIKNQIVEEVRPSAKDALDALLDSDSKQPIKEHFFG